MDTELRNRILQMWERGIEVPTAPPASQPLREEFYAYPGTVIPHPTTADIVRVFSRFAAICPAGWQVIPPASTPSDESFLVAAEYGRVKLVRFSADLTTDPNEVARQQARRFRVLLYGATFVLALALVLVVIFVPAVPEALSRAVKAIGIAIATFGVAGGVASLFVSAALAVVDPVVPVIDVDLQDASTEARRRWVSAQRHIITLAVIYAKDEGAADAEWREDWQSALRQARITAAPLLSEGLLSRDEYNFLHYHLNAMSAWPALYCRDFMAVRQ